MTSKRTTLPPLREALKRSPTKQPECSKNKAPDDDLVLITVALEAQSKYVVLGRILAKGNALLQAKRLGALGA